MRNPPLGVVELAKLLGDAGLPLSADVEIQKMHSHMHPSPVVQDIDTCPEHDWPAMIERFKTVGVIHKIEIPPPAALQHTDGTVDVGGNCPACHLESLAIGPATANIRCRNAECSRPDAVALLLAPDPAGGKHVLYIETDGSATFQHPLIERVGSDLFTCEVPSVFASLYVYDGMCELPAGTYHVDADSNGSLDIVNIKDGRAYSDYEYEYDDYHIEHDGPPPRSVENHELPEPEEMPKVAGVNNWYHADGTGCTDCLIEVVEVPEGSPLLYRCTVHDQPCHQVEPDPVPLWCGVLEPHHAHDNCEGIT